MKRFLLRSIFLLSPVLFFAAIFILEDPMKVVYTKGYPTDPGVLMNDRLYAARYLKGGGEYNAFIFGSSRSRAFKTSDWIMRIREPEVTPYHTGMNDESLYGMAARIEWLAAEGYELNHVLIQFDHRLLSLSRDHEAHIFREYWSVSGESSLEYYKRFILAFLNPSFLYHYLRLRWGEIEPAEELNFFWDPGFRFTDSTGDIHYVRMDSIIAADSLYYYQQYRANTFYARIPDTAPQVLDAEGVSQIRRIQSILIEQGSDYRVVISPNYDQQAINSSDLDSIYKYFGRNRVFNFSGQSQWTDEVGNYYEEKHFKPFVARWIMDSIYAL